MLYTLMHMLHILLSPFCMHDFHVHNTYILIASHHILLPKIQQHNNGNMDYPKIDNISSQPTNYSNITLLWNGIA